MSTRGAEMSASSQSEAERSAIPSVMMESLTYSSSPQTHVLDELRAREYGCLDRLGHIYLDYTGAGLYAESQVRAHLTLLLGKVFGMSCWMQPRSSQPTGWI